jgi:hypothetical protein
MPSIKAREEYMSGLKVNGAGKKWENAASL